MADLPSPSTDPASLRLPWPIQAAAVLGIAVPIGMLAHLWHQDQEALTTEVETLKVEQVALSSERDLLAAEASHFANEAEQLAEENAKLTGAREQLDIARAQLAAERDRSAELGRQIVGLNERVAGLNQEVAGLNDRVDVLGQRENSLLGIIDLLEGEVASAERRLEKLAEAQPQVAPELRHLTASAIAASSDPQLRRENSRLRNELQKHDEQVVELLAEISTLNQEIEIVREQGARYRAENNNAVGGPASLAGIADEAYVGEE